MTPRQGRPSSAPWSRTAAIARSSTWKPLLASRRPTLRSTVLPAPAGGARRARRITAPSVWASSVRRSSALGIVRIRSRGIPRCRSTIGSRARSVAITASAAAAHAAPRAGAADTAARFNGARVGSLAPNSSSPCGLSTSGARRRAHARARSPARWRPARGRCRRVPPGPIQRPASRAQTEAGIGRASIEDGGAAAPGRGKVWYGTNSARTAGMNRLPRPFAPVGWRLRDQRNLDVALDQRARRGRRRGARARRSRECGNTERATSATFIRRPDAARR